MSLRKLPEKIRKVAYQPKTSFRACDGHRDLSPEYAYGRHRGPAPSNTHRAAVMIALIPTEDHQWAIPLTLRPTNMVDHGGQVSLPGGRAEPSETPWQTSCREFGEELGCETHSLLPVGFLSPIYVYASRHVVEPIISVCRNSIEFHPNPEEVAELLYLPLSELIAENAIRMGTLRKGSFHFEAPGFHIGEHFVWGATAMILGELRRLVRSLVYGHE